MNFYSSKFVDFAVLFFKNQKVKICLGKCSGKGSVGVCPRECPEGTVWIPSRNCLRDTWSPSAFPLTPKRTFLRPKNLSETSRIFGLGVSKIPVVSCIVGRMGPKHEG